MPEYRWKGVHRLRDHADDIQQDWQSGIETGLALRWRKLGEIYMVKKRQWTVVTGIPSHGKSTWMDNVMDSLATLYGWKFLVISPENQPVHRHMESLIEIHAGKKFVHPQMQEDRFKFSALSGDELGAAAKFVDEHFLFVEPSETDFNIDYLLELAWQIKHGEEDPFDFDGMLIDPYNELEHKRPNAMTETEYISSLLGKFRRFVRTENVHGWFIAHPTKQTAIARKDAPDPKAAKLYAKPSLYDISGGAHWYNKCDMGVVVYRNVDQDPETTTIDVQKVRFRECGKRGEAELYYDFLCNRYVDNHNELLCFRGRE